MNIFQKLIVYYHVFRLAMPFSILIVDFYVDFNTFFRFQDLSLLHGVTECAPKDVIEVAIKEHLLVARLS